MKKNIKKSAPKTTSAKPAVLGVVSPIVPKEFTVEKQPIRERDHRLPAPGSIITKNYRGNTIEVKVLEIGFEYQGKIYKSISRVAMEIVKRSISGYVFFGLSK